MDEVVIKRRAPIEVLRHLVPLLSQALDGIEGVQQEMNRLREALRKEHADFNHVPNSGPCEVCELLK